MRPIATYESDYNVPSVSTKETEGGGTEMKFDTKDANTMPVLVTTKNG